MSKPPIRSDFSLNWEKNIISFQGRESSKIPEIEFDIFAALIRELQFLSLEELKIKTLGKTAAAEMSDKIFFHHMKELFHLLELETFPLTLTSFRGKGYLLQIKGMEELCRPL